MQPILNWKNHDEYKKFRYADKLPSKQWSWEFLRRQRAYQEDYDSYLSQVHELVQKYGDNWKTNPKAKIFIPPLKPGESQRHWEVHVDNPRREYLHIEMAKKWCLLDMYSPQTEWNHMTFIKPWYDPMLISTPDEFEGLLKKYPTGPDDVDIYEEVGPDRAVIAFDLTVDIEPQLKSAGKMLTAHRRPLKKQRKLNTIDGRDNGVAWFIHLRVLDALLETPRPTNADIGEVMGYDKFQDLNSAGSDYVSNARAVNYKKILKKAWDEKYTSTKKKKTKKKK